MQFYTRPWPTNRPPDNAVFPCVVLVRENWDDFGHKTLCDLHYFESLAESVHCGRVKVIKIGVNTTPLPDEFADLDDTYCSLGQSTDYYREFAALGTELTTAILTPLRDIVLRPDIGRLFRDKPGFEESLLRGSEPTSIWNGGQVAPELILKIKQQLSFTFSCRVPGAASNHNLTFKFGDSDALPDRTMVLIGKNGTGKTQLLRILADAVSGLPNAAAGATFLPRRPRFTRVLAVSYSAFDRFRKDVPHRQGSYEYCGIYTDGGGLMTPEQQLNSIQTTGAQLIKLGRQQIWKDAIDDVFGEAADRVMACLQETITEGKRTTELSSGELILSAIFTQIIARLEHQALLVFDEPELHLHPNAVAGFVQALNGILEKLNCYSVLATHSPLILQQVPAKYVRVLNRAGNEPMVWDLQRESFGENLSVITEDIFFARAENIWYREVLEKLRQTRTVDQVDELFGNKLGLNALAVLESAARVEEGEGHSHV